MTHQLSQRMHFWQLLFHFSFFFLFLLSFFFIESELKLLLFALWAIFLALFNVVFGLNHYFVAKNILGKQNRLIFFLLFLWSGLIVLSVFFSAHLSLSLEKMIFYLIAFGLFVFFSFLPSHFLQKKQFFYQLSILTLLLNLIVLAFTFFPPPADLFPKMNLLIRSYGHNHYAAYLLLVLPVFWWQLFSSQTIVSKNLTDKNRGEIKFFTIILLFLSYLLIVLSLARLVLFFAFIQFLLIYINWRHDFNYLTQHSFLKQLFRALFFLMLGAMIIFLVLTLPFSKQKGENHCPLSIAKKEICQPLTHNDRWFYWRKAYLLIKQQPLFGVGLQGFQSAGRPLIINQRQALTSYAHNIFLHNLAETGILLGTLFMILMVTIYYAAFYLVRQKKESLHQFLWLGAVFSLANALFDFDWHFFVIFCLTLIFLAIIIQAQKDFIRENFALKNSALKIYFFAILAMSLLLFSYNLAAFVLIKQNKQELVIRYLPFADRQVRFLLRQNRLSVADFDRLYPSYRQDAEFIYKFLFVENLDLERQKKVTLQYANLDPVGFLNYLNLEKYSAEAASPIIEKLVAVLKQNNWLNNSNFFDYWQQKRLAEQIFNLANQAFVSNNLSLAVDYYHTAWWLNPYIFDDLPASFLLTQDLEQLVRFFQLWPELAPASLGTYFYDYMALYQRVLMHLFQTNRLHDLIILAEAIFVHEQNFSWFLWRALIDQTTTSADQQKLLLIYDHFQNLKTWYDYLPVINKLKKQK